VTKRRRWPSKRRRNAKSQLSSEKEDINSQLLGEKKKR
jgi:hypothetical protein